MNPKVLMGVRILLGVFMLFFGLNKFLNFMEFPPIPGDGGTLMGIYISSGFMKLIGVLEIVCAILLLVNKYVPLALVILAAILFNALMFHLMHDPGTAMGAALGCILSIILVWGNKHRFSGIFSA
jgi:uncharacterized membrane protein YphA (DoxX/SURF4 family)